VSLGGVLNTSVTTPTIASGFGGANSTVTGTSTAAFKIVVGNTTTSNSGVITLPAATNGWVAAAYDITQASNLYLEQSAFNTTSVTLNAYSSSNGSATNLTAGDVILVTATAF
jgi:hypothetical protein